MSQANVEVVRSAFAAFQHGDMPAVLATMDPDVEWSDPDQPMPAPGGGGTHHGLAAVRDVFASLPETWDGFRADPDDMIDAGERVVVTGRFGGRARGGGELDAPFAMVFELRDGRIVRYRSYADTARVAAALEGAHATG